eukprot:682460-Prorocentrum_minimum.AAC.1
MARVIACRIHQYTYVLMRNPLSGSNRSTPCAVHTPPEPGSPAQSADEDVRGYGVDVKGYSVDVRGYSVDVRGYGVAVRGYGVDVRGYGVDARGYGVSNTPMESFRRCGATPGTDVNRVGQVDDARGSQRRLRTASQGVHRMIKGDALGPQPRFSNVNNECCVIHRCNDQPRAKTRFSPIGNPRGVFLHTQCPSTTSEVDPSLGTNPSGFVSQGVHRMIRGDALGPQL